MRKQEVSTARCNHAYKLNAPEMKSPKVQNLSAVCIYTYVAHAQIPYACDSYDNGGHYFPLYADIFLPNDHDFGCTEYKKRKQEREYTPEGWCEAIRSARKRNPFVVSS